MSETKPDTSPETIGADWSEAIELVKKYRDQTGKTQIGVAHEIGLDDSTMSQFMRGTYKTPHTIIPKVKQMVRIADERSSRPSAPPYVETTISQMVNGVISYCHYFGQFGIVL
jgi:DNA transposition AAA+ family ATPase